MTSERARQDILSDTVDTAGNRLNGHLCNDQTFGSAIADRLPGDAAADTLIGGRGLDLSFSGQGHDVIYGEAMNGSSEDDHADHILAGSCNDYADGGFGHARRNGGYGADRCFHAGIADHGRDWVQDYTAAEGNVPLRVGGPATVDDFQVNFAMRLI